MNIKVHGKILCVNTTGTFDTAGSPPPPKPKAPRRSKKPKK